MARITKAHRAGLDFLDESFFNELLVHRGMDLNEQNQLDEIIKRVSHMVESKFSGREAEIIKHLAYAYLEISLASSFEEIIEALPKEEKPIKVPLDYIKQADEYKVRYLMALMLTITEKTTGVNAIYALEIFESLKDEFVHYSPIVRRNLVSRCFAYEYDEVSLNIYCWLTVTGVLPVKKNSPDRIVSNFSDEFMIRLTLLADYEMIKHNFSHSTSKSNPASAYLNKTELDLDETLITQLLEMNQTFNESSFNPSLKCIPLLSIIDPANYDLVQKFFEQWGSRKFRLRMHSGTLASWLSFLGAGMVEINLVHEYTDAAIQKLNEGAESVQFYDLKVPAIFNASDNKGTVTELIENRLSKYGLRINSDTLYRSHSMMRKTELRLINLYCRMTREQGVVFPVTDDDWCYISLFINSGKMFKKSSVLNDLAN